MTVKAVCCHQSPGRVRLRLAGKPSEETLRLVSEDLLEIPHTASVRYSPVTGSIVLHHENDSDAEYLEKVRRRGAIEMVSEQEMNTIVPSDPGVSPDGDDLFGAIDRLDRRVLSLTGGEVNLRKLGIFAFGALGLLQFGRGQGLPAGLTLLVNAARFMRKPEPELNLQ